MTATRRLAAILAADVAGYSRLIGADEEGTLNRLKRSVPKYSIQQLPSIAAQLTEIEAYRGIFHACPFAYKNPSAAR